MGPVVYGPRATKGAKQFEGKDEDEECTRCDRGAPFGGKEADGESFAGGCQCVALMGDGLAYSECNISQAARTPATHPLAPREEIVRLLYKTYREREKKEAVTPQER